MNKRQAIGKKLRFTVFSRDEFACRYCGRQSDAVVLHIDHIVPVCQGGTNDPENLITACQDCNLGKSGRTPEQAAPSETDRLRLAQERNEQLAAFESIQQARQSRQRMEQEVINFWCECRGATSMHKPTLSTILKYVEEFGAETVFKWIQSASNRFPYHSDQKLGMYISGIRRCVLKEREL